MTDDPRPMTPADQLRWVMVTAGGLGRLRPAPGTWGSLPPVAVAGALLLFGASSVSYHVTLGVICVVFSIACVAWGQWAEERFGRKDPRFVVADEVAGQCIALALAPSIAAPMTFDGGLSIFAFCSGAFLLFRIFDITKPPPAHALQGLKGGLGILVDDLVAGAYALLVLQIVLFLLR